MSISDTTEHAILNLIFRAVSWTDYATSTGETLIQFALHSAPPGETGTMSTNEGTIYPGYARTTVARGAGFQAAAAGKCDLTANQDFPASSGAGTTITDFSTGHTGAAAQPILWSGGVSPAIAIGAGGITPRLKAPETNLSLD